MTKEFFSRSRARANPNLEKSEIKERADQGRAEVPGWSLRGYKRKVKTVTEDEQKKMEKRLRRRANSLKEEMLADLQERGLVPKPEPGRRKVRGPAYDGEYKELWEAGDELGAGNELDDRDNRDGGKKSGQAGGQKGLGTVFVQMVEDYVALWITREKLEADIDERGVTVMDEKRGLPVENCSVSARVRVSKQMTTIIQSLGYKDHAVKARRPEVEDDEL